MNIQVITQQRLTSKLATSVFPIALSQKIRAEVLVMKWKVHRVFFYCKVQIQQNRITTGKTFNNKSMASRLPQWLRKSCYLNWWEVRCKLFICILEIDSDSISEIVQSSAIYIALHGSFLLGTSILQRPVTQCNLFVTLTPPPPPPFHFTGSFLIY